MSVAVKFADVTAVYAALVATGVGLYQWRRDRQHVDVSTLTATGGGQDERRLIVRVVNQGQRTVYIDEVSFGRHSWRGSKWMVVRDGRATQPGDSALPAQLEPGQSATFNFTATTVRELAGKFGPWIGIANQTGKMHAKRVPSSFLGTGAEPDA